MLHRTFFVTLLLTCACVNAADTVVRMPGSGKHNVRVTGLQAEGTQAATFQDTLVADLERSGWFRVVDSEAVATVEVVGRVTDSADGIRFNVRVVKAYEDGVFLNVSKEAKKREVRREAHLLCDAITRRVLGKQGMAAARIALIGDRGQGKDLYICDSDGQGMVRITDDRAVCLAPRWSPGGETVIYTSFHSGGSGLYQVDLRNRRRRRISALPGLNAGGAISPDGELMALVLSHAGNPELYLKNLGTGRLTRLTRTSHAAEASPSWSPDGTRIVYVSDSGGAPHLYVLSRDDRRAKRLTWRGTENVNPDWGEDGRIVYCSRRNGSYSICVMDPRTKDDHMITRDSADYEEPSWAPDGRHVVCTRTQSYESDLYLLDTLGDPPIPLTSMLRGQWYSPDWGTK